jgi:hypothetical protein
MDSTSKTYSTTKHATGLSIGLSATSVSTGTTYKVSGTLTDTTAGKQLASKTITFTADSPITISDKTTNTNGFYSASQAAPSTAGTYSIQSHFAGDDLYNSKDSATTALTVTSSGPSQTASLTLNGIANVGWGTDVTVTGKLSDSASGTGIGGATITFDGTGAANLQSVTTNTDGTFTAKGKAPSTVATGWGVQAHFAGDNSYNKADSTIKTYSTTKHATGLSFTVPTTAVAPGATYKVSGTLTDTTAGGAQLASKTITFTADSPIKIADQTTNTNGFYSASQAAPSTAGTYSIQSHFAGDDLYNSKDSATKTLTVS